MEILTQKFSENQNILDELPKLSERQINFIVNRFDVVDKITKQDIEDFNLDITYIMQMCDNESIAEEFIKNKEKKDEPKEPIKEDEKLSENQTVTNTNASEIEKNKMASEDKNTDKEYEIELAKKILPILSVDKRYWSCDSIIKVGQLLHNISDDLYETWKDFSKKKFINSLGLYGTYSLNYLEEIWNGPKDNTLTIETLKSWALEDNRVKFFEIFINQIYNVFEKNNCTLLNISKMIHTMFSKNYKCTSVIESVWYEYIDGKWIKIDGHTKIKEIIAEFMYNIRILLTNSDKDRLVILDRIFKFFEKKALQSEIIKECQILFFDAEFKNVDCEKVHENIKQVIVEIKENKKEKKPLTDVQQEFVRQNTLYYRGEANLNYCSFPLGENEKKYSEHMWPEFIFKKFFSYSQYFINKTEGNMKYKINSIIDKNLVKVLFKFNNNDTSEFYPKILKDADDELVTEIIMENLEKLSYNEYLKNVTEEYYQINKHAKFTSKIREEKSHVKSFKEEIFNYKAMIKNKEADLNNVSQKLEKSEENIKNLMEELEKIDPIKFDELNDCL